MLVNYKKWAQHHQVSIHSVFPSLDFHTIAIPNMGMESTFFGEDPQHENLETATQRLEKFQQEHPKALLANGYLEQRAFYNTKNYERNHQGKKEYRNIHLGTDFWVPYQTPVHAPFEGTVVISHYNNIHKDYGPLLVLEHLVGGLHFYTLYGHLTVRSLTMAPKGTIIKQGELLAHIGDKTENGHWVPHLHFQLITDLLEQTNNYPGVAYPSEIELWKTHCPNPSLLFTEEF